MSLKRSMSDSVLFERAHGKMPYRDFKSDKVKKIPKTGKYSVNGKQKNDRAKVQSPDCTQATTVPIRKRKFTLTAAAYQIKNFLIPDYNTRFEEFKKLFKMDDNEKFIVDYSCAFHREILVHGRMYVSQNYLCFHANIFSWETTLIINLKDIERITKKKTVKFIPNAVQVCKKDGNKLFFTSLVSRTKTYHVLTKIWQLCLMNKDIEVEDIWHWMDNGFEDTDLSNSEPEMEPQIPKPALSPTIPNANYGSLLMLGSDLSHLKPTKTIGHRKSSKLCPSFSQSPRQTQPRDSNVGLSDDSAYSDNVFETSCTCESHFGKELLYEVYPASVEKLFELIFSNNESSTRFRQIRGMTDLITSEWKPADKHGTEFREISYTKHLDGFGPKSCRVIEHQECINRKDHVCIVCECHNEGIPYGDVFDISMTYCITRISNNTCRLRGHGGVIFRKNSWGLLKSLVEKTSFNAMNQHYGDLRDHLRNECSTINDGKRISMDLFQSCTSLYDVLKHKTSTDSSKYSKYLSISALNMTPEDKPYETLKKGLLIVFFILLLLNVVLYYFIWTHYKIPSSISDHMTPRSSTNPEIPRQLDLYEKCRCIILHVDDSLNVLKNLLINFKKYL